MTSYQRTQYPVNQRPVSPQPVTRNQRAQLAGKYQSDGMTASSPQKLLILIFERIKTDLTTAGNAIEAKHVEPAHLALVNAQELVFELRMALDVEAWPAAAELQSIYDFLTELLIEANLQKSVELTKQALEIVVPLADTWNEAYQQIQQHQAAAAAES